MLARVLAMALSLCLSVYVCHKSVFYWSGWTDRAGFWHGLIPGSGAAGEADVSWVEMTMMPTVASNSRDVDNEAIVTDRFTHCRSTMMSARSIDDTHTQWQCHWFIIHQLVERDHSQLPWPDPFRDHKTKRKLYTLWMRVGVKCLNHAHKGLHCESKNWA